MTKRDYKRIQRLKYRHYWHYKVGVFTPMDKDEIALWHDSMTIEDGIKKGLRPRFRELNATYDYDEEDFAYTFSLILQHPEGKFDVGVYEEED